MTAPSIDAVSGLVERLRGVYRIPITDGLGPAGGEEPTNASEFVRTFPSPPIQREAADALEAQARELATRDWRIKCLEQTVSTSASRISALEDAVRVKDQDAERWRALMSSQRMHMMGSFGFDYVFDPPDSKKTADLVDVVPRAGDHMHFGIEFWSEHSAYGDPAWPDGFPRKVLTTYVDEIRARTALSNGEPHDR